MDLLEQLREIKQTNSYDINKLNKIADEIEEEIGPAEMWNTLRPAFSVGEFLENLEYIAREHDL